MMRKQFVYGLAVLALSALGWQPEALSADPPKAELVMQTNDPWLMVIGSDSPEFVLYSDGTVIFLREPGRKDGPRELYSAKVSENERALFAKDAAVAVEGAKPRYLLVHATDQPLSVVALPPDNLRTVSVYGRPFNPHPYLKEEEKLPPSLYALMKKLREFDSPKATPWLPEKIEVLLWPFEYAKGKPVVWPKDWPDLDSSDTVRRQTDSYSVFLPSANFQELQKLLKTLPAKSPVSINGKLMAVSYRFPFPDQASIRKALYQKPPPRTKPYKQF